MSLIIHKHNKSRELKLKLSKILHSIDHTHLELFPGSNPGFFKNALGNNRLKIWLERRKKVNSLQTLTFSLFLTPVGIHLLTQDPTNFFYLFLTLWGTSCTVILFWENLSSIQKLFEIVTRLRKDYVQSKKENAQLRKDHEELKKNFYEFKSKFEK